MDPSVKQKETKLPESVQNDNWREPNLVNKTVAGEEETHARHVEPRGSDARVEQHVV